MATDIHIQHVENVIKYKFKTKALISHALIAAGADENNYDGYRRLSQIGASLVDLLLAITVYGTGVDRSNIPQLHQLGTILTLTGATIESTHNLRQEFVLKTHYSLAAKKTGIDGCIKKNPRTEEASPEVHRKAINAIIAGVLLDSWDIKAALCATLSIFIDANNGPRLRMLSASSPTMEILPVILQPVLARDTGTVSPVLLAGQSEGVEYEDAIVYTLFDSRDRLPIGQSPEHQRDGPASETSMTDPELDMDWCLNEEAFGQGTTVQNNVASSSLCTSIGIIEPNTEATSTTPTDGQENDRFVNRCQLDNTAQSGTTRTTKSKMTTSPRVRESIQHMIDDFLVRERQKCINDNDEPFIDYLRPEIQCGLAELGNKFLATLFLKIGGSQQIVALRRIARNERSENINLSSLFEGGLSTGGRLRLIFALDEKVAGSQLSRWYHILELYKNCGGCDALSFSGNLHTTPATFGGPRQSRGNPIHREDARVAEDMVHECFPEIPVVSSEFRSKLRLMKQIRKLGKRLHLLVRTFGEGILGLMFDLETRNDTMATADSRLLGPTEDTFKGFVDLLNYSQGDILREASKAVWPLLLALLRGTLWLHQPFPLETVDPGRILGLAKGSPSLFRLIKCGGNPLPM